MTESYTSSGDQGEEPGLNPEILGFGGYYLLKGLPCRYIEMMASFSRLCQFEAAEQLFRKGSTADGFYLIRHGSVGLRIATEVEPILIQTIGQGDVVGWSWLVPPYRWQFDATAEKRALLIHVDSVSIRRLCEEDHDFGYEMHKRISQVMFDRLNATRLQLSDALLRPPATGVGKPVEELVDRPESPGS